MKNRECIACLKRGKVCIGLAVSVLVCAVGGIERWDYMLVCKRPRPLYRVAQPLLSKHQAIISIRKPWEVKKMTCSLSCKQMHDKLVCLNAVGLSSKACFIYYVSCVAGINKTGADFGLCVHVVRPSWLGKMMHVLKESTFLAFMLGMELKRFYRISPCIENVTKLQRC